MFGAFLLFRSLPGCLGRFFSFDPYLGVWGVSSLLIPTWVFGTFLLFRSLSGCLGRFFSFNPYLGVWGVSSLFLLPYLDVRGVSFPSLPECLERFFFPTWVFGAFLFLPYLDIWSVSSSLPWCLGCSFSFPTWYMFGAFLFLPDLVLVWGVSFPSLPGTCLGRFFSFLTWLFGAFLVLLLLGHVLLHLSHLRVRVPAGLWGCKSG